MGITNASSVVVRLPDSFAGLPLRWQVQIGDRRGLPNETIETPPGRTVIRILLDAFLPGGQLNTSLSFSIVVGSGGPTIVDVPGARTARVLETFGLRTRVPGRKM